MEVPKDEDGRNVIRKLATDREKLKQNDDGTSRQKRSKRTKRRCEGCRKEAGGKQGTRYEGKPEQSSKPSSQPTKTSRDRPGLRTQK